MADSEVLAVISTGLFTGAAVYVTVVDGPAMLKMNPDAAVEYWQAFFPTAAKVQNNADTKQLWAASAGLMVFMLPYTGAVMMPRVNYPLMASDATLKSAEWKTATLKHWCRLHAVRTAAGAAAFLASAVGLSQM